MLAERWHWGEAEIMHLPRRRRLRYLEVIEEIVDKERGK